MLSFVKVWLSTLVMAKTTAFRTPIERMSTGVVVCRVWVKWVRDRAVRRNTRRRKKSSSTRLTRRSPMCSICRMTTTLPSPNFRKSLVSLEHFINICNIVFLNVSFNTGYFLVLNLMFLINIKKKAKSRIFIFSEIRNIFFKCWKTNF